MKTILNQNIKLIALVTIATLASGQVIAGSSSSKQSLTLITDTTTVIDDYTSNPEPDVIKPAADSFTYDDRGPRPIGADDLKLEEPASVALDWMAGYIDTKLNDQVVGYAYVINHDGNVARSNAHGFARTAQDDQLDMSINTRSYVASVTKQITAVATIRILEEAGLSINTRIDSYLPDDWVKGSGFWGINGLTFKQLMDHTSGLGQVFDDMKANDDQSGLDSWGNDWDGLQFVVANGTTPDSYSYKNANYALLRILIPQVWVQMGGAPYIEVTEGNHSSMYLAYVQQNIFEPAGIYNVACWLQPAQQEALAYSMDYVEQGGVEHTQSLQSCGGHAGFRLSALELASYLAHLRHTSEIISYTQLAMANAEDLGWSPNGGEGIHWKGGDNFSTLTLPMVNNIGGMVFATEIEYRKSSHACVMVFPNGYEASLVINSEYKTGFDSSACGVLKDAYELAVD